MESIKKWLTPIILAAAPLISGCGKNVEHSFRKFVDVTEIQNDCRTALANAAKFPEPEQNEIVCEKYITGSPRKGGIVKQERISCENIGSMTSAAINDLLVENFGCFAPNVSSWPNDNGGPAYIPY